MAPKRAKASSGPLGPLLKESLQVSASSGEMRVRPQNCTGTNSSLNLVLIPTWVLTERPEECNPAHPVSPLERPEPKECGRGTTPFQNHQAEARANRQHDKRFRKDEAHVRGAPGSAPPSRPAPHCGMCRKRPGLQKVRSQNTTYVTDQPQLREEQTYVQIHGAKECSLDFRNTDGRAPCLRGGVQGRGGGE
ncbi:uncharacterized protein LOC131506338 isoform X3 [Neofelis nebulosa]|uniref:uncharacterized protein LOC131506338 isoform X3 n=1 Tax=Neofelis nebulosa TaxID=61452 RepID=UPI00272A6BFD|nr:uncharacterized protein LOC131506338 isoform X3 [Neofelis nebulosa]